MSDAEPKRIEQLENAVAPEGATPSPTRLPPTIPDHDLLRLIGRGAYGEVWLARSVVGEYRAVKVVYRQRFDHDRPYEREFNGIRKFEPISRSQENQVDILHIGRNEAEGYFYYVMELGDDASVQAGSDLSGRSGIHPTHHLDPAAYVPKTLKSTLQQRARLPLRDCVNLGMTLATALDHLHKNGLVHRDVKPSNIIFINGLAKLADIGLVTSVDATRSHVGTLGFAPPEGPGTVAADLYSLGKVLYEAATGRDRQEFPELPTRLGGTTQEEAELFELNQVILKACDNDPRHRYQSAEAMRAELTVLASGRSLVRKRGSERRLHLLVKGGSVLVALGVVAALFMQLYLANREQLDAVPIPDRSPPTGAKSKIPNAEFQFVSLEEAIQSRANQYPRLTPETAVGKHTFTPFRLNTQPLRWGNEYYDAVRFTTPPAGNLDMVWAFTFYNRKLAWMLLPLAGSMERGFRQYWHWPATRYKNVPAPAPDGQNLARRTPAEIEMVAAQGATNEALRRILEATAPGIQVVKVQGLSGKFLDPKRDYLLVFEFFKDKPANLEIALNFVPQGISNETNCTSLEKVLGLIVDQEPSDEVSETK